MAVAQRSTESYSFVTALNLQETPISAGLVITDAKTDARTAFLERNPVTVPPRSGLFPALGLPAKEKH